LVETDILKIMGCVEKKNTLSVVTSDIRRYGKKCKNAKIA